MPHRLPAQLHPLPAVSGRLAALSDREQGRSDVQIGDGVVWQEDEDWRWRLALVVYARPAGARERRYVKSRLLLWGFEEGLRGCRGWLEGVCFDGVDEFREGGFALSLQGPEEGVGVWFCHFWRSRRACGGSVLRRRMVLTSLLGLELVVAMTGCEVELSGCWGAGIPRRYLKASNF